MAKNPYFENLSCENEQELLECLNIEAIEIFGFEFIYLPREFVKEDMLFGEDVLSKFTEAFKIEAYIENVDGFEGDGDILSKFGLEIRDAATIVISQKRWDEVLCKFPNITRTRPKEGDLIFFPLNNKMFEIMFVEHEDPFYQLGKTYVYKVKIEMFEHSDEDIDTGAPDIDAVDDVNSYQIGVELGAGVGNYEVEESVFQGIDLVNGTFTGEVISWDPTALPNPLLILKNITGVANLTDQLVGETSAASYALANAPDTQENLGDPFQDNVIIEVEADGIFDFTEIDPFSEGDF